MDQQKLIDDLTAQNAQLIEVIQQMNAVLDDTTIFFRAELLKTFDTWESFNEFDKSTLKQFYDKDDKVISLDSQRNCCNIMADFETARDKNTFPVTVYRLIRTSDVKK